MVLCVCPNPSVDKYIWVEQINAGGSNRITKEQLFPGGKGIHVALALKEMGELVVILGFWGGATGQWIKTECEKVGIACLGPETEGLTRTCITFKSDDTYNDTELLGVGPQIEVWQFDQFLDIFKQTAPHVKAIALSGSWPPGAPDDAYAKLISLGSEVGVKSFLDCSGNQLKSALSKTPFVIHLNKKEGQTLYPKSEISEIARSLSSSCTYAALTAGADGLYFSGAEFLLHAKCTITNLYSAVGSGDCLVAGLIYAHIHGLNHEDMAKIAVACGAANCLREDLGMLYKSDVEKLTLQATANYLPAV